MKGYPLGRRMAVDRAADWPKTAWNVVRLVGAASVTLSRAGRKRDTVQLHDLERRWARRVVKRLNIDLTLDGLEHVEQEQAYVVAPLHEGFADVAALFHLPLDLTFVARAELADWPLLGRCLRDTRQIIVDPEAPVAALRAMHNEARTVTAAGESVVVFSQGSILGIEIAFQQGADWLAQQLDVPILPVILAGGHRVWEWPYSPLVRYGMPVYLEVLPPVAPGELVGLSSEMRRRALHNGHADPRRFDPDRDGYWDGYAYEIDGDFPELAAKVASHRTSLTIVSQRR